MNDVCAALNYARQELNASPEARLEAEILLCYVLNKNRAYLFAHQDELLTQEQFKTYQNLILKRVDGTPIAYLTGEREFWSLPLKVNQHTLIPRHETERLVELVFELIPNKPNTSILDLGTGSGAIALAIGKERPNWLINACDSSLEALKVAQENAKNLSINNVSFYHSNWFDTLPKHKIYDVIVSNPPYISPEDPHLNQGDVRFEPSNALISGEDGLADLQYIIKHAYQHLLPGGLLLLEHGYDQKFKVRAIMSKLGYENIHCWQDIQGNDRVSGGWHPKR